MLIYPLQVLYSAGGDNCKSSLISNENRRILNLLNYCFMRIPMLERRVVMENHNPLVNRVTALDVARLVGVSQPTVSRVFSNVNIVTQETREKVMAAALQLGYKPNAIARSLTSQKTNIVGIVTRLKQPFFISTLERFTNQLQKSGKQVLLFNNEPDQQLDDVLFRVLQYQVDALIITVATLSSKMADVCARQGTKVLLFNRYILGSEVSAVCCDNVESGRMVANYLLDTGHRRFAFLSGSEKVSTSLDRRKGFSDRLKERGISDLIIECGEYTYASGSELAKRLFLLDNPPDAIFCANDIMAIGAMDTIRYDLGLRIPEDVSIIGFDDIQESSWPTYSLTTVHQPLEKMVDAGMEVLLNSMENQDSQPILQLFKGEIVQRSTVRNHNLIQY